MQIKNKEDEIIVLQDKITSLNEIKESLQLKLDKEIAEHQRIDEELSKINNERKVWTSEKSSLERQVSNLFTKNILILRCY